jgi:transposase InsO family protein
MGQMKISTIRKRFLENNRNISKTARELNIDRKTVRKWTKKKRGWYNKLEYVNKKRLPTTPKNIKNKISLDTRRLIVHIREEYGYDQDKISLILKNQYNINVSGKSIYNIIKKRKPYLISKRKKYRRPHFQDSSHMRPSNTNDVGYVQMDVKYVTPQLSGLPFTCYEYGIIDIYSRYKYAWILPTLDTESAIVALRGARQSLPFKIKFVQTDNGWEFSKRFSEECKRLGIKHYYIHKSTPNENAVIERSFRTDEEEFFFRLKSRPKDINELNILFQKFLHVYNTFRPHIGIGLKTPLQMIQSEP